MKETAFIEKNKKKWREFEKLSEDKNNDPDKLSELFIELTEDLSYAKTFYPKRSVRVYLNFLAQKVFVSFHKQKRAFISTFGLFWKEKLPLEMYKSRKQLLYAFLFFAISILIGVVSSQIDPEFTRVILGDGYVDMTIDNINNGDPMAVYKNQKEGSMFLAITYNNIRVAFFAFILGMFFSVGTVFLLAYNGIMLGAFQYFFYSKGLFITSFLTIWIHGAFEISVIIIAGCAGLVLGNGLLFPKTLSRIQSLQLSAKRGMNLLMGTLPVFVAAGFLEGYVTRHTEMPDELKWFIILSSFAFILIYYVIYPRRVAKKVNFDERVEEKPIHMEKAKLTKHKVRDIGHIFYDTFRFYRNYMYAFSKIIFVVNTPLILIYLFYLYLTNHYGDYWLSDGDLASLTFASTDFFSWIGFFSNVLFFSINIATVIHCATYIGKKNPDSYLKVWFKEIGPFILKTIPFAFLIYAALFYTHPVFILLLVVLSPLFVLTFYPSISSENSFVKGLSKGMSFGAKDWGLTFISVLMILTLVYIFTWVFYNPFLPSLDVKSFVLDDIIKWHTITVFDNYMTIKNFISSFLIILIIQFLLPLVIGTFVFQFFNVQDKEEAVLLRERFQIFGKRNKLFENHK